MAAAQSLQPIHPPLVESAAIKPSIAQRVQISVQDPLDHDAPAILHEPHSYSAKEANHAAVVLVSGAGGGVSGPGGIYPSLADKLALLLRIPCMRLDYREPAKTELCTTDMLASFDYLGQQYSSARFVVVGWSFGGSPCFAAAAREPARVAGVATIASQTAHTAGVAQLRPRPLLLLHGTGDTVLSYKCAETLYQAYGHNDSDDGSAPPELKLFDGDDHGLTQNSVQVEDTLFRFVARCLGFGQLVDASSEIQQQAAADLVESRDERIAEMQRGHDLQGGERLDGLGS